MMDDLKIYERLSDLLYKDLLGMASKEEKQELDSLCEEYGVKEMDRDEIVARLQGTDDFDGREAYRKFKILKKNERIVRLESPNRKSLNHRINRITQSKI